MATNPLNTSVLFKTSELEDLGLLRLTLALCTYLCWISKAWAFENMHKPAEARTCGVETLEPCDGLFKH